MTSTFRKTVPMKLPAGGRISTEHGVMVGRWLDRQGKKQCWPVIVDVDGAPKVYADGRPRVRYQTKTYYIKNGEVAVSTRIRDKSAAKHVANEVDKRADMARAGLIPISKVFEVQGVAGHVSKQRMTIPDAIEAYHRSMVASGLRSADKFKQTITRICQEANWRYVTDISTKSIEAYLTAESETKANQSINTALQRISAFCHYLKRDGIIADVPTEGIKRRNPAEGRRHVRRSLSLDEVRQLTAAATRDGVKGQTRALIYRLICCTGMRRDEVESLTPKMLQNDDIRMPAEHCKNKREAVFPLPAEVASALREHIMRMRIADDKSIFGCLHNLPARMRKDLAEARIAYEVDGRVIDVHALRGTYGTLLAAAGVPLAVVQKLMRHSDPRLTSNTYLDPAQLDLRGAVERIQI